MVRSYRRWFCDPSKNGDQIVMVYPDSSQSAGSKRSFSDARFHGAYRRRGETIRNSHRHFPGPVWSRRPGEANRSSSFDASRRSVAHRTR